MKLDFNTITGRFLGRTKEQWEAEKVKYGLSDEQLCDVLNVESMIKVKEKRDIRFFQSGKLGTPEQLNERT